MVSFDEAAFLHMPPAMEIFVIMGAFLARWCTHRVPFWSCVSCVRMAAACIDPIGL